MSQASKIAIVTGAGSGVGKAAALALMKAGYKVALVGRRVEMLQEVFDLAPKGQAMMVPTDVADPVAVKSLFDKTVKEWGRIDLLFNNAGVGAPAIPLEELTVEQWTNVVNINLNGMFFCLQQAFRVTATQHAVTGLTKTASLDGRKYDIAVGQIDIGNAATPMAQRMASGVPQANGQIVAEPLMNVDFVGQSIVYMDSLPLEANVLFHTIMANKMPFVGRG